MSSIYLGRVHIVFYRYRSFLTIPLQPDNYLYLASILEDEELEFVNWNK